MELSIKDTPNRAHNLSTKDVIHVPPKFISQYIFTSERGQLLYKDKKIGPVFGGSTVCRTSPWLHCTMYVELSHY